MKTKSIFHVVMLLAVAAVMTALMGCNPVKNDPDQPSKPTEPAEPDNTPVGAFMNYSFATYEDLLDVFNIDIEYYDEKGNIQKLRLKEAAWGLRVDTKSLPAKFGMRVLFSLNSSYSLNPYDVVNISYDYSYNSSATNSDGKAVGEHYKKAFSTELDCESGKILQWLDSYATHPASFMFEYDASGKGKAVDWK